MADRGIIYRSQWDNPGYPDLAPKVVSAEALDDYTVQVIFDTEMQAEDPLGAGDALNPNNYSFQGLAAITPESVEQGGDAMTYLVYLNEEMTIDAGYTVTVANVLSSGGQPLDTEFSTADFTGLGTQPTMLAAVCTDASGVVVVFSEFMLHDANLANPANYVLSGPTSLTIDTVTIEDGTAETKVTLTFNEEMRTGGEYAVTAYNVVDLALNPINTQYNDALFYGIGVAPQVEPSAAPFNEGFAVRVRFTESMTASALNAANYSITFQGESGEESLEVFTVEQVVDEYTYELVTAEQTARVVYTVHVSPSVVDMVGNSIDPAHDTATFDGTSYTPPLLGYVFPDDDTDGVVRLRDPVTARAYDGTVEMSGIDQSSWWVSFTYRRSDGVTVTDYAVKDGAAGPNADYRVTITGDPDSEAGLYASLRPRRGWQPSTQYTIKSYVRDNDGNENELSATFLTGRAECFEDKGTAATEQELLLVANLGTGYNNSDTLRQVFLTNCTASGEDRVRVRTLMYWVNATSIKTALIGVFDFTQITDLVLYDKTAIAQLYNVMTRFRAQALLALDELTTLSAEAKIMLRGYIMGESPLYYLSAIATIIALATYLSPS